MRQDSLGIAGVGLRFAAALVLVLLTFNPTGWSYFHWLSRSIGAIAPPVVLAGIALVIGWGVYLSATLRSLGLMGMLLWAAFFGALVWTAVFYDWLSLSNTSAVAWVLLVILACILGLGMCWSHLRRRMSGQTDVDEVSER